MSFTHVLSQTDPAEILECSRPPPHLRAHLDSSELKIISLSVLVKRNIHTRLFESHISSCCLWWEHLYRWFKPSFSPCTAPLEEGKKAVNQHRSLPCGCQGVWRSGAEVWGRFQSGFTRLSFRGAEEQPVGPQHMWPETKEHVDANFSLNVCCST